MPITAHMARWWPDCRLIHVRSRYANLEAEPFGGLRKRAFPVSNRQARQYGTAMADEAWIVPPPASALDGSDHFIGLDATVADFWRFAMNDLRMNNARGYLAEYLVAKALDLRDVTRVEWDAYDLLLDGVRVEVKSSAYLQAWEQPRLSRIEFSGLRGTRYHPRHGYDPSGKRLNAHVYVFCVQTATSHEDYRPLDLANGRSMFCPGAYWNDSALQASDSRRSPGSPVAPRCGRT